MNYNPRSILRLSIVAALLPLSSIAQDDDDIYTLMPFSVTSEREQGYRATTTISASRLNVPLDEVPVNIPVMTADFIDDTVSITQREALEWHAAVEGKNVRGFGTEEFYRHGFQHLSDTQGFLIQRMEIVRGPTAILSGPIHPGGAINVITKQAVLGSDFGESRFQHTFAEDHSYQNIGLDINAGNLGPEADYGSTLAFRFVGAYQYDSGAGPHVNKNYGSFMTSARWRPLETTTVTAEFYHYKLDSDRTDQFAAMRLNMPVDPNNGAQQPVAIAALDQGLDIPASHTWLGPDASAPETNNEFLINVNHQVSDNLFFDLSFTRADRDLDFINMFHGNGMGTFRLALKDGAPSGSQDLNDYMIERRMGRSRLIGNIIDQASLLATWIPDADGESNHQVMFGFQSFDQDKVLDFRWLRSRETDDLWHSAVPVTARTADELAYDFSLLYEDVHLDRLEVNSQDTLFVNWTGEWLDGQLHTMIGWFNTSLTQDMTNFGSTERIHDSDRDLPQLGAVYDINEDLGVYVAVTESAAINTNQAPPADQSDFFFPPKVGEMKEIGIRFDLFEEKVVGSLGYYNVDQTDVVSFNSETQQFVPLGDVESTGFDLDIFYYPTENWSVIFGWANNDKDVPAVTAGVADRNVFASPRNKFSVWTKYNIIDGPLSGISFGGGFKSVEGTPTSRNGFTGKNPDRTRLDVFAQKKGALTDGIDYYLQLNIRNLTGEEFLNQTVSIGQGIQYGWRPNSADRYEFHRDPEYTITGGLKW